MGNNVITCWQSVVISAFSDVFNSSGLKGLEIRIDLQLKAFKDFLEIILPTNGKMVGFICACRRRGIMLALFKALSYLFLYPSRTKTWIDEFTRFFLAYLSSVCD